MTLPINRQMMRNLAVNLPQMRMFAERKQAKEAEAKAKHQQLWTGFSIGDTVIFTPDVTVNEFGVMISDDAGAGVQMDGVIKVINGDRAQVLIKRVIGRKFGGGLMTGVLRFVSRDQIDRVHDGEPSIWESALTLTTTQRRRDRPKEDQSQSREVYYWDVSQDEINNEKSA